jgi:hypothetical protein
MINFILSSCEENPKYHPSRSRRWQQRICLKESVDFALLFPDRGYKFGPRNIGEIVPPPVAWEHCYKFLGLETIPKRFHLEKYFPEMISPGGPKYHPSRNRRWQKNVYLKERVDFTCLFPNRGYNFPPVNIGELVPPPVSWEHCYKFLDLDKIAMRYHLEKYFPGMGITVVNSRRGYKSYRKKRCI